MFNLQHLTKYLQNKEADHPKLANLQDALPSTEEYEVEKIVGERKIKGKLYYHMRWRGYDAEDNTWQTARDLRNTPELLKAWRQRL